MVIEFLNAAQRKEPSTLASKFQNKQEILWILDHYLSQTCIHFIMSVSLYWIVMLRFSYLKVT